MIALVLKLHDAGDLGEERVVLAQPNVITGLQFRSALANQDGAAGDQLPVKPLHAQPLGIGVATIA